MSRWAVRAALAGSVAGAVVATVAWSQIAAPGAPPPEQYYLSSDQTIPVNGKGGSNIMGPYVLARDWPQIPGGRKIDSGPAIYAESPDRIYVGTRGTRAPYPVTVGWQRQTIKQWFRIPDGSLDVKHDFILNVFNREGKLIEQWKQYDANFPINTVQRWHVNVNDPNRYNYIEGSHIVVLSHDGQKIIKDISPADVPTKPNQRAFSPEGMAFLPDGGFWVTSHDRVIRFSRDFKYVSEFGTPGSAPDQMLGLHDLIYDNIGHRFYICDQYAHRVVVYDDKGKLVDVWPNIISPSAIRMTRDRKYVWVGDIYAPRFYKFDLQGHMITSFGTWGIADGAISGIHDFDVDSEGNLYVANHDIQASQKFIPLKGGNREQIIGPLLPR
jgi:hypothetical protein